MISFNKVYLSPGIKNQPSKEMYFFKVIYAQFYYSFNWLKVNIKTDSA